MKINVMLNDRGGTQSDGTRPQEDAVAGAAPQRLYRASHAQLLRTGRFVANQCGNQLKMIYSIYFLKIGKANSISAFKE